MFYIITKLNEKQQFLKKNENEANKPNISSLFELNTQRNDFG